MNLKIKYELFILFICCFRLSFIACQPSDRAGLGGGVVEGEEDLYIHLKGLLKVEMK